MPDLVPHLRVLASTINKISTKRCARTAAHGHLHRNLEPGVMDRVRLARTLGRR